jgi:RHS repeat-associated protein
VALELNDSAQVTSYEEYHPYGTTAYQAKNAMVKSAAKRYRYTGMERDEETGFEYHHARYYLPWLGRWLNCDPIGISADLNLFRYALNNPVMLIDINGESPKPGTIDYQIMTMTDSQLHTYMLSESKTPGATSYFIYQATGEFKNRAQAMASKYNMGTDRIGTTTVEHIRPKPPEPKVIEPTPAPLENVKHVKPWTPPAIIRESWEHSIDVAADSSKPWYERAAGFGGAIGGYLPTAGESIIHGIIAMPQLAVTETIAAGEHGARAYLLFEAGADGAAVDEVLASGQAGAEGIANTAGTVAMVGGLVSPKGPPPPGGGGLPPGPTTPPPGKPLTYGDGYNMGSTAADAGLELVLGKFPGNVQYVSRTPGTVTLDVPTGWTPNYNAGYVRGFMEQGGKIRFTSEDFTGTFKLEAQQVLGIPGAP